MNGGVIRHTFGAIDEHSMGMQSTAQNIQQELEDLKNHVAKVLGSAWEGANSEAFSQVHGKWQTASQDLHQHVHAIGRAVADGNAHMQQTEASNAASWNT